MPVMTFEDEDQVPPAYTRDATTVPLPIKASSSSTPTLSLAPPTNFLTIVRDINAVKGRYTIDPSMPRPPGAAPVADDDGKFLNMSIVSDYCSINVVVDLVRNDTANGPALLAADSRYGSVTIAVHDRTQTRFRLKAVAKHGAIVVRLPPTFVGAISTWLKHGKLTFSPAVQARLVTFLQKKRDGEFFIGDYTSTGYTNDEAWMGDYVRVQAEYGKVKIEFVDEESEVSALDPGPSRKKGFFRRLLS